MNADTPQRGVPHELQEITDAAGGKIDWVAALPDGSGAATMSFPLPADHWLTRDGHNVPPMPFRMGNTPMRREWAAKINAAGRYAIRGATMNGKEQDFDPDAMLQNLCVGMLGYWTEDGTSNSCGDPYDNPDPIPPRLDAAPAAAPAAPAPINEGPPAGAQGPCVENVDARSPDKGRAAANVATAGLSRSDDPTPSPFQAASTPTKLGSGPSQEGAVGSDAAPAAAPAAHVCGESCPHASDCAVHNAPALPVGPCDCGAKPGSPSMPNAWPGLSRNDFGGYATAEEFATARPYDAAALIVQQARELAQWRTWGIAEIAIRNPSVMEYMKHWEARAERAERELAATRAAIAALCKAMGAQSVKIPTPVMLAARAAMGEKS